MLLPFLPGMVAGVLDHGNCILLIPSCARVSRRTADQGPRSGIQPAAGSEVISLRESDMDWKTKLGDAEASAAGEVTAFHRLSLYDPVPVRATNDRLIKKGTESRCPSPLQKA